MQIFKVIKCIGSAAPRRSSLRYVVSVDAWTAADLFRDPQRSLNLRRRDPLVACAEGDRIRAELALVLLEAIRASAAN